MNHTDINNLTPTELLAALAVTMDEQSRYYCQLQNDYAEVLASKPGEPNPALSVLSTTFGSRSGELLMMSAWIQGYLRERGDDTASDFFEDLF